MNLKDLLTEEQNDIRQMARKFVDKEIMPIREKLEEDYSLVESVLQKLVDLGIQKSGYPEKYGSFTGREDAPTDSHPYGQAEN